MPILPVPATDHPLVAAFHAAYLAAHRNDDPGPAMSLSHFTTASITGWYERAEAYADVRDGRVTGGYSLRFPTRDNTHVALIDLLVVVPEARRRGLGSALLAHATERATGQGRRVLIAEAESEGPGSAFARARGFTPATTETRQVLDLRAADRDRFAAMLAEAREHAADYELEVWRGDAPEHLYADLALVYMGMNDAPIGDLDMEDSVWDAERVRAAEREQSGSGLTGRQIIARHRATGEVAGYTSIKYYPGTPDGWGRQADTVVLRPHRGRRLGMTLKLANALALLDEQPAMRRLTTWNATSNAHMLAINDLMGFRPLDTWHEWQVSPGNA
ncbi:GNAT family N-acetyltransferase [Spongiactinospora sp. TRM90649]|uniref:GNAT family N-acetyltransferase n=1 Tax=Spongiactinospora sp. TRM90649 TaxID=3031114 RepID=UPI0023F659D2|nr:GNAT family N-acetyltransferase [Spongiactinospora sp. TRM90649]MDF5754136.1 GNAT family N-acetyltransferase [Spongiactinospora sp. TRM90649]